MTLRTAFPRQNASPCTQPPRRDRIGLMTRALPPALSLRTLLNFLAEDVFFVGFFYGHDVCCALSGGWCQDFSPVRFFTAPLRRYLSTGLLLPRLLERILRALWAEGRTELQCRKTSWFRDVRRASSVPASSANQRGSRKAYKSKTPSRTSEAVGT
jgi:hypothetical protein